MKTLKLHSYSDPGHVWLRVPLALVRQAERDGMTPITRCSYMSGNWAYLEEDCDIGPFLAWAGTRYSVEIKGHNGNAPSRIRNKPSYRRESQ